ncbi:MAG: ligC [Mycobacterium sp.]|nr:ligC [Mycobacterium sp.]
MQLPVMPPVAPMLATPVAEIPPSGHYEPKWDGFRAIIFKDGDEVEIGSRNERPLTRYFPEVVAAARTELPDRCVVDGEIVIAAGAGLDFEALLQRIHPAGSRVALLAEQTPASFVAFDLLALGDDDLMARPFAERRALLHSALADVRPPVHVTPATTDRAEAERWFGAFEGAGLDGLVAKPVDAPYTANKRTMFKIKHERTADCVLAGFRVHKSGPDAVGSLLLGLYDGDTLISVGVVGSFSMARRRELFSELQPLVVPMAEHPWAAAAPEPGARTPRSAEGSRWNAGKDLSFVPLRPELVVEVRYDHMEGTRFRHTTQFVRWRPDRDPRSCTFEQLETPVRFDLDEVLPGILRADPAVVAGPQA